MDGTQTPVASSPGQAEATLQCKVIRRPRVGRAAGAPAVRGGHRHDHRGHGLVRLDHPAAVPDPSGGRDPDVQPGREEAGRPAPELRRPRASSTTRRRARLRGMETVMRGVDFIFHAAALKQVPSCEFHPHGGGAHQRPGHRQCARRGDPQRRAARWSACRTDKAVYPINAMGMSKALMEKVMVAKSRVSRGLGTVISGTRYGNVHGLARVGDPAVHRPDAAGQPITITDPAMTRFMMTLDEAVELVSVRLRVSARTATSSCRRRRRRPSSALARRCWS